MSEHTAEPWCIKCHTCETPSDIGEGDDYTIEGADGTPVGFEPYRRDPKRGSDARRLVACVNACAGIPTEDLERHYTSGGGLDEAIEEAGLRDHVNAVEQREQLLAALCLALPFVEDHEGDEVYKPGAVSKAVSTIKAAIAAVEQPAYHIVDRSKMVVGWIEWTGGECPVPDGALIYVRFRDGHECPAGDGRSLYWEHHGCLGDIVAYRFVRGSAS